MRHGRRPERKTRLRAVLLGEAIAAVPRRAQPTAAGARVAADPEAVVAAAEFGREVDNNPPDEVFLDWVKESAAACAHTPEEIQQALRDTEYVRRRPRGLLAEYGRVWARAIVADEMEKGSKKDAMVFSAAGQLEVTERTIWAALAPAPAAPPLTKERFRKILADNIEIAERSGNARAAELLRRVAATF